VKLDGLRSQLRQLRAEAVAATAQAQAYLDRAEDLRAQADRIAARLEKTGCPEASSGKINKPRTKRKVANKPEQKDRPFLIWSRPA
jgi:predicted ribosome quality control (RQC) complex YloA/Tae2 family protein